MVANGHSPWEMVLGWLRQDHLLGCAGVGCGGGGYVGGWGLTLVDKFTAYFYIRIALSAVMSGLQTLSRDTHGLGVRTSMDIFAAYFYIRPSLL